MRQESICKLNMFNATWWARLALVVCFLALVGNTGAAVGDSGGGIRVGGTALTRIHYPREASETVKFAASELSKYIK
jgi:hypothetical protein